MLLTFHLPLPSQTFKDQLNSYILLRWWSGNTILAAKEKRFPPPFRGHDPRKWYLKKRSEVLKRPAVTRSKES